MYLQQRRSTDAQRPITENAELKLLERRRQQRPWHSSAHLMAEATPAIKLAIGPPIENGFYYDIDFGDHVFSDKDFPKVQKMAELAKQKNPFVRKEVSKADAVKYFEEQGDDYKLELISDLEEGTITFYTQGGFTDLCRGPHIPHTGAIKAIKLLKVAGAYWKGDENRAQLTRIYGVTFPKKQQLKEHLALLEEAKKRDHRKLGKELGLFSFSQSVGQGLPLWLPKGADLRSRLEDFLKRAQRKAGYQQVVTPHIGNKKLYETSGHWDKYGEDSFRPIQTPQEGDLLKPVTASTLSPARTRTSHYVWQSSAPCTATSKAVSCTA